jgi:6-phosphogluconolactonase (cycloisomerase 2 family)
MILQARGSRIALALPRDRCKLAASFMNSIRCKTVLILGVLAVSGGWLVGAQEKSAPTKSAGGLKFEEAVTREDLQGGNSVEMSADGRFLYATPWPLGAVVVFQRDNSNGRLKHVQTLRDARLAGDTSIAFSPSGKYAVAACFNAKTAVLMNCDTNTGQLKILHAVRQGDDEVTGLDFPIDALFSPDGRFVYVLDGTAGGIVIFKVGADKLEWQKYYTGKDGCLAGARGATLSPDGKLMYVAGARANALTVLERDAEKGGLRVKRILRDEEENVEGLAGVFGVTCSPDGEFIYTTSGRFEGDSAVGVFRHESDGKLKLVHELIAERDELPGFLGGNRLVLSPDAQQLYAVASRSGAVACFERDTKTGRIKVQEIFTGADDKGITAGAAGVAISSDGKYVYIAAEGEATISIYSRGK